MSRRGAGVAFCAIAAVLFVGWYVVAALFRMSDAPPGGRFDGTEVPRWLDYVGTDFRNLALLALVAGVTFLVWAEVEATPGGARAADLDRSDRPGDHGAGSTDRRPGFSVPSAFVAGALLAGLGGALLLIDVGMRGHLSGRGGELLVLAGLLGLVAAALAPFRAIASAVAAALAGVTVAVLAEVGPRSMTGGPLPPAFLLASSVLVFGAHVARERREPIDGAVAAQVAAGVGLLLHTALFVPLLALGLGVPGWAILLLIGLWAAMGAAALRLRRERPWLVLVVPAATAAVVAGLVALGGTLLGWTA